MFARMSDVRTLYSFSNVAIDELLEDAVERFRVPLTDLGFAVCVEATPDLPAVRADRSALLHALENLIDNAIRYSDSNPDSRRVLALRARQTGSVVQIEVADRGPGIPPDERSRVFEKFYRGRTTRVGGTGLGLTIVHRVVKDHGGTVTIGGGPEHGTTVEVSLPLARANA
jgi:signal transduction histidine kinase